MMHDYDDGFIICVKDNIDPRIEKIAAGNEATQFNQIYIVVSDSDYDYLLRKTGCENHKGIEV